VAFLGYVLRLGACADLVASATTLATFGPSGPFGHFASDGAWFHRASVAFEQVGALFATVVVFTKDGTSAVPVTNTACYGAFGPVVERIYMAVDRAFETVAFAFFQYLGAFLAAMALSRDGGSSAGLQAEDFEGTAGLVTNSPVAPWGHFAILRARLGIAVALLIEGRAFLAVEGCVDEDGPGAALLATVAGLRAFAEVTPSGCGAIKSASLFVACSGLLEGRALNAAVRVMDLDLTLTVLGTTTTGLGALVPYLPVVHFTVDGASMNFAVFFLVDVITSLAAVLSMSDDIACARALVFADAAGVVA